jgi:predicted O-methyltransferase YrrM
MEHFYQNIGEDWFAYSELYRKMIYKFKDKAHFVEVGSWRGRSAAFMAVEIQNSNFNIKFDCVDTWEGSIEHQALDLRDLYEEFLDNLKPVINYVNPIRKTSLEASNLYEDKSLDFVFIDASHQYEDVLDDINAWLPKVKLEGILAGHDYFVFEGVRDAVHEAFKSTEFEIDKSIDCWIYKNK